MSRRGFHKYNEKDILWILVIGVPIYLMVVHPVVFWLLLSPLIFVGVINLVAWFIKHF